MKATSRCFFYGFIVLMTVSIMGQQTIKVSGYGKGLSNPTTTMSDRFEAKLIQADYDPETHVVIFHGVFKKGEGWLKKPQSQWGVLDSTKALDRQNDGMRIFFGKNAKVVPGGAIGDNYRGWFARIVPSTDSLLVLHNKWVVGTYNKSPYAFNNMYGLGSNGFSSSVSQDSVLSEKVFPVQVDTIGIRFRINEMTVSPQDCGSFKSVEIVYILSNGDERPSRSGEITYELSHSSMGEVLPDGRFQAGIEPQYQRGTIYAYAKNKPQFPAAFLTVHFDSFVKTEPDSEGELVVSTPPSLNANLDGLYWNGGASFTTARKLTSAPMGGFTLGVGYKFNLLKPLTIDSRFGILGFNFRPQYFGFSEKTDFAVGNASVDAILNFHAILDFLIRAGGELTFNYSVPDKESLEFRSNITTGWKFIYASGDVSYTNLYANDLRNYDATMQEYSAEAGLVFGNDVKFRLGYQKLILDFEDKARQRYVGPIQTSNGFVARVEAKNYQAELGVNWNDFTTIDLFTSTEYDPPDVLIYAGVKYQLPFFK